MKYIVRHSKVAPTGELVLDRAQDAFKYMEEHEIYNSYIPYTKIFKKITIRNYNTIPAELVSKLTNQYLHGSEIVFDTPTKRFSKSYQLLNTKEFLSYQWSPFSLEQPIPKSLANFKLKYNGKNMSYLDAIKTLTSTKYIPNEIWNALDAYSQSQIDKCKEYNKGNYSLAETWYKQLMKDCNKCGMKMYSPNKKTYYEAIAEEKFEFDKETLKEGLRPLSADEITFLKKYAPAYGVEIPQFTYRINSRRTDHGYTEEPERIRGMSNADWDRVIYDPRKEHNLPKGVRKGLVAQSFENNKLLRDAYFNLIYIMKHLKDEGLMPGWKRCPVCHEIYRESEGCECGECLPIKYVMADNLFYGTASGYEDYDDTKDIYGDIDYTGDWD
jgi:hypothetical protein